MLESINHVWRKIKLINNRLMVCVLTCCRLSLLIHRLTFQTSVQTNTLFGCAFRCRASARSLNTFVSIQVSLKSISSWICAECINQLNGFLICHKSCAQPAEIVMDMMSCRHFDRFAQSAVSWLILGRGLKSHIGSLWCKNSLRVSLAIQPPNMYQFLIK